MITILKRSSFIFMVVLILCCLGKESFATIYFYYDAEGGTVGQNVPSPPPPPTGEVFCQTECSGAGAKATVQSSGGAAQGSKYFQWQTTTNQHDHYTEMKNRGVFPLTGILGKTFYMAFYMRFDRIGGNDLWHEGSSVQSNDKLCEMRGSGLRWTVGVGQWDQCRGTHNPGFMANQNHRFTVYGGNPSYHLNPSLETYGPNRGGYSCTNTPQLEYERWYSVVLGVTISSSNSGARRMWLDGVLISEDTGITTSASSSPTITHMDLGGTLAQGAYDSPAHYRKFDAWMLTDDWQDVVDGGYVSGGGGDSSSPSPPAAPTELQIKPE